MDSYTLGSTQSQHINLGTYQFSFQNTSHQCRANTTLPKNPKNTYYHIELFVPPLSLSSPLLPTTFCTLLVPLNSCVGSCNTLTLHTSHFSLLFPQKRDHHTTVHDHVHVTVLKFSIYYVISIYHCTCRKSNRGQTSVICFAFSTRLPFSHP